jgi:hypothetical protein
MTRQVKLAVYAILIIGAFCCGYGFSQNFAQVTTKPGEPALTNQPSANTSANPATVQKKSSMMRFGAGLMVCTVALGLLLAYDLSHFVGRKVEEFIWEGEGEEYRTPEYEHAENVWANGEHLEAIQLMRDYLKTRPREQYVALRIAEIYEKDLHNFLASALEYEEILKKPLPPERWGWSAIHLANLYSGKLGRSSDAQALLRRIVDEYPMTAAATKARRRLGDKAPDNTQDITEQQITEQNVDRQPVSQLPPGFRPKAQ